ncbi:hydrolase 1, exosortase A system-associated [Sphingomonas japonica]|uniref:Exosortase A-associated hydrolase 1 n=1 Tax=Sphingomonas japonica TaxID=511662 RepID=A0ABX0U8D6_9SPHN|nr:hydrolase 1, exosortase A system-associated [Sphingomonas japonica]NIJ25038.1 exosortase A-associated hydrolase 1 [Sphingomonas japonica]
MRRVIAFACGEDTLVGTIDSADRATGLVIVSGGNEIRMGAHRGMASLAADLADRGVPVLRFDRRGIGDSTGANRGFEDEGDDIAAAVAAFRSEVPQLTRVIAFGNCDAASALAFYDGGGIDGYVLANPWVIEPTDELPPASAIRARYVERLKDPRAWLRLAKGGVNLAKLARGLRKATASAAPSGLADRVAAGMTAKSGSMTLLIARRDNTAVAFQEAWKGAAFDPVRPRVKLHARDTGSHSFAKDGDHAWLLERLLAALG